MKFLCTFGWAFIKVSLVIGQTLFLFDIAEECRKVVWNGPYKNEHMGEDSS